MFKIIFKDIPIKHIHTKYGDFEYSEVIYKLKFLFGDSFIEFHRDEENLKNWFIDEKIIKIASQYTLKNVYEEDKNSYKIYQELTEHIRIMEKLTNG